VLFLVDRSNLGEQAEKEFQGHRAPDVNRKFTELPGALAEPRTSSQRSGIQRPPRRQSEREDSPLAKFGFSAATHVVPGHSTGLVCESPAGSPFDLGGPGGFDIGRALRRRVVKAGQQFRRDVGAFLEGQGQGFAQNTLRS
jgi:hypothetical protein